MLLLGALVWLDQRGLLLAPAPDTATYDSTKALVIRVIDGDTFVVAIPDPLRHTPTTRVRLWGVDTPELGRDGQPDEPWARQAKAAAQSLIEGKTVTLILEKHRLRGAYGRLLAHVLISGQTGSDSLAERLVNMGLARADARWPHRDLDRLRIAEREAKQAGVGLWQRQ